VGAGQQKAIPLIFTPSTLGQAQGQLFVISNAANVTDAGTLSLSGKGIDGQITLTPSVVSFDSDGGVEVGGAGAQQTVKLTNSGEATLTITRMEAPTSGGFTVSGLPTQDDAGLTLQPNGEWPLTVTFTPENRGFVSTSAIIRSDSVMNPVYSMALRGTGVAAALELQPKDVYFGKSNLGVPTSQNLSIKNEGERDLYVSNIAFIDVDGGMTDGGTTSAALDFSMGSVGGDGGTTVGFPLVVGPKQSKLVPVNFTPRQAGPRQARALVFTNDKLAEANLSGEGVSPNLAVSSLALVRGALDFGSVVMNKPSTARVLKLTNTGEGRLTVSTLTLGGADAASFILTPPTLPITLQPGAFTEVSVSLTPNAERQFSAQLVIASNDPETPSLTVPLVGIGVRQQIGLSKNSLEFGQQLISHTSNARSLLVKNSSDTDVTLSALAVDGTGASQFTLLQPLGVPLVLTPGQEQKVELTFTPQAEADVNCVLKISFGDLTLNVALRGKGIPAVLSIAPSPLDFGGVRIGSGVRENPLTITNVSSDPIVLAAPEVTYKTGEPFTYDAAGLQGRELAPGMSLIISVGYQPEEETLSETTLSFGTTTPTKPRSVDVQIKGTATSRLLFVDQERWDFGFVKVDKQVESKVFTITNKSAQKQRAVVKMRDSQGAPFILGTKELANAIAPGGTAIFSVDFDPDHAGVVKDEVQVWLQGATEAEALIPVQGQGTDLKSVPPTGCSASTTEAGTAGLLALLTLVGLGSRRRRRE
jgi:MYXO-CTERM domain-containing protein